MISSLALYQVVYLLVRRNELMKIYVRERQKVGTGVKQPRFRVVAVVEEKGDAEKHAKFEAVHFRKIELEQIAKEVGAQVVYLEEMPEEERGEMKAEAAV
jgi:hypothetical protein